MVLGFWQGVFELIDVLVVVFVDYNFALLVLGIALIFVVLTKVAVLADALGIHYTVRMRTFSSQLGSTLGVVAILAHAISIVCLVGVAALENVLAVLLDDLGLL